MDKMWKQLIIPPNSTNPTAAAITTKSSHKYPPTIAHQLYEILLLNTPRNKDLLWTEIYSLFRVAPSEITQLLQESRLTTGTYLIDPLWILTQSHKNYPNIYTNYDATSPLIRYYNKPRSFLPHDSAYGVTNSIISLSKTPRWCAMGTHQDWYWKQLFGLRFFRAFYHTPGVREVRLTGSVAMRVSQYKSDIDVVIKTKEHFVYSTRMWIKLIVLKLSRRDVHIILVESCLYVNSLLNTFFNSLYKRTFFTLQSFLLSIIEYHKYHSSRFKIDTGIVYSSNQALEYNYGNEMRQKLWLWESVLVCCTQKHALSAVKEGQKHILFEYNSSQSGQSWVNTLSLWVTKFFWLLLLPLNVLQMIYYYLKKPSDFNFVINSHIIGFVPRIYKDGYFTKVG